MNQLLSKFLSFKQNELDQLEKAVNLVSYPQNAVEILGEVIRPEVSFISTNFQAISEYIDITVIDEPLKSYLAKRDRIITDGERKYKHYRCNVPTYSIALADIFKLNDFNSIDEVLCNAYYFLVCKNESLNSKTNPVLETLYLNKQENLDLGIIQVTQPALKDRLELTKFYNVHLEFLPKEAGQPYKVHLHCIEFPRDFKLGRQGIFRN